MLRLDSSAVSPRGQSSGLRPLPHVTMDRRRYTWHLRHTAIGRAESRCGMGTGAFGRTLLSEFANNSPRGASPNSEAVGVTPGGFALSPIHPPGRTGW